MRRKEEATGMMGGGRGCTYRCIGSPIPANNPPIRGIDSEKHAPAKRDTDGERVTQWSAFGDPHEVPP